MSGKSYPKRGDVYWVNLDPTAGSETKKTRPAVIVSNNVANQFSHMIIIAPVTSNAEKIYPFEVPLEVAKKKGKAMLNQIRAIDKARLGKKILSLDVPTMEKLDEALKLAVGIN